LGLATGDFNSDGKLDLVTANFGSNNLSLILGNGMGGFGLPMTMGIGAGAGGMSPSSVAVWDANNDNRQDLLTTNYNSNNTSTLLRICP
jgi:hypothetical protein